MRKNLEYRARIVSGINLSWFYFLEEGNENESTM